MKKVSLVVSFVMAIALIVPFVTAGAAAKPKTLTGVITKISGSQLGFLTGSGIAYSADIANAALQRKNGSAMAFPEFLVGDKLEVKGTVWADNSISAASIRDMTLYAHTGTFSGKIISIDPSGSSFTIQSSQPAFRNIRTNTLTAFKKNGSAATFANLQIGMTAKVKGAWERKDSNISAASVEATLKLINIDVTGRLTMKGPGNMTIIANNTIYGLDTSKAKLQNKSGKSLSPDRFNLGDTLRVSGKHVSGSVQIIAETIKNSSVTK